jgi:hypothetical protein
MLRLRVICLPMVAVWFSLLAGCDTAAHPPTPASIPGEQSKTAPASSKIEAALAQLSAVDRQTAERQRICPVSGELLGSMGKPIKVHVKDLDVFICCDGCKEDLQKSPDEYLAKLKP